MPRLSRLAVLWNKAFEGGATYRSEVEAAAHTLGIALSEFDVRRTEDFRATFGAAVASHAEAFVASRDLMQD